MLSFDILRGPGVGKTYHVDADEFTLGRSALNKLVIDDESVSSRHAQIAKAGTRYVLSDLKSTNGTYVNGHLVKKVPLYSGDEIRLGNTALRFSDGTPPRKSESSAIRFLDDDDERAPTIHATVSLEEDSALFNITSTALDPESLAAAHRNLAALYRITAILNSSVSIGDLFDRIVTQILRVTSAERVCIMLIDEDTGKLVEQKAQTRGRKPISGTIHISHTIVSHVMETARGVLTTDAPHDERFAAGDSIVLSNIHSAMCVPLQIKDEVIGIIYVDNFGQSKAFTRADLELLTALGHEAGVAVENTMLYEANLRAERLAAIGHAIAGLSHHIKNILWCMQGGALVVQRALDRGELEGVRKGWEIVHRNERKIGDLVMNMLTYSKEREPQYELCDINGLIREAVELASPIAPGRSIQVTLQLDESVPRALIDSTAIHRCLLNLLTNAVDAIPEPAGEVLIATRYDEAADQVVISVSDTGTGVDEEDIARLFDPFVSTKGSRGTGLGLAVVRKIVEEHQGEMQVANRPEGGAQFAIHLPVSRPQAAT